MKSSQLRTMFAEMDLVAKVLTVIGTAISIFSIIVNCGIVLVDLWIYKAILMAGIFAMGFIPGMFEKDDQGKRGLKKTWMISVVFMLMGMIPCFYITKNIVRLQTFYGSVWTQWDIIFGVCFILATLELTRRCFGLAMPCIAVFFFLYVLFGKYLPASFFGHTGFSFERTISYMFSPAAMFGEVMNVFARTVFIYLLFGAFLEMSGATDFFIDLACSVAGKWRGGPAKVAVISSALLGTISGNAVANVATTGAVTIPLMKKTGYKDYFAGAVEAVASTGGQFLPPVMGAGAFIMAELLSLSYTDVIIAAVVPATLYFVSVFMMVDLEAVRLNLKGMLPDEVPDAKKVFREKGHLGIPVLALIYMLLVMKMSVTKAGLYSVVLIVLLSWLKKDTRMGLARIIKALYEAARSAVGIGAVISTAGLIIGTVGMTGLGTRFSSVILAIAGDNLFLVALFTALICIVLGMGLPTTAAYVISVSVASATMTRIGVPGLAAHLFVFYFACISTITPPVAASSYTAAAIAKAPVMKTGLYATMLRVAGYIVPFIFISSQELMLQGEFFSVLWAVITAVIGLASVANAAVGVFFARGIRWNTVQRILLAGTSIFLIIPGLHTDIIGFAAIAITVLIEKFKRHPQTAQ